MSRRSVTSNLDALTNTELRELLVQHGLGNQPVTNSTRSVLISRLKREFGGGGGSGGSRTRHTTASPSSTYLGRYSSAEEESDRESASKSRGARQTISAAASQSISRAAKSPTATPPSSMPPPASTASSSSKRKRSSQQPASYSFFAPSNTSSVSYGTSGTGTSNNIASGSSSNNYNLPTIKVPIQPRSSVYIPPPTVHSSDTEESDRDADPYLSYGKLSGLSFPKRYSPAPQDQNSPTVSMRSPTSFSPASSSRLSDSHSSGTEDSPYVSDFTKRLLQFRQEPTVDRRATTTSNLPPPNPRFVSRMTLGVTSTKTFMYSRYFYRMPNRHSLVHQASPAMDGSGKRGRADPNSISRNTTSWFRGLFHRMDDQYGVKQNFVPFVLVGAVVLFVAFLVFMYLTISPDLVNTITAANAKYTVCQKDSTSLSNIPGENCVYEDDLESAIDFLRLITPELQARVERHLCKDPGLPSIVTAREAIKMRTDFLQSHSDYETQRQLANMEYLVEMNPQWHISNLDAEGSPVSITKLRQIHQQGHSNAFGILKPRLPLSCLFLRKLQTFFFVVGTLGLASVLAYLGNWLYKYQVQQKHEWQQKVNRMVSQILQIVMEQAATFPNNSDSAAVVVNHLRDKIIEPAQRTKHTEKLWREAIFFLENNESRVQFEVGTRNGEECRLVRWVDTIQLPSPSANNRAPGIGSPSTAQPGSPGSATSPLSNGGGPSKPIPNLYNSAQLSKVGESMLTAKKWQSPAFDKSNKITSPPTPCLKIRQMFDKYEAANPNLRRIIADAILEKVGPMCKIYDILLEPQACCVYVRCATAKDAGIVHDEINGWWFDNRLVSIKFLRLERFMDRFPESKNNRHILRPSNPQKLSLTQCNQYDEDEEEEDLVGGMEEEEDMEDDDGRDG